MVRGCQAFSFYLSIYILTCDLQKKTQKNICNCFILWYSSTMTSEELAKQDPREIFPHDPRELQELLAEVHDELGDRHPSFSTDNDQPTTD